MSVHYKFKSALDFETISFDGLHISVADLKKEIINKKKLGKTQDFDLQITNAQTKQEYCEDSCLIPKNTSLIIARVPLTTRQTKKSWDPTADKANASASARATKISDTQASNIDLTQMNGTEEDKIKAMVKQSTMDYDPKNYQKVRGGAQTGEVPSTYRCHKCQKMGHWIKNCPLNTHHDTPHTEIKRNTGIPRSFINAAGNSPANEPIILPPMEKKQEIPDDLICSICKDLFTDAVMIPCCGSSFCDECVRTALLESEDNECPDCNEKGSSPNSLIPNRFLRNSVNSFKNETGYNKPRQQRKVIQPPAEEQPSQQHHQQQQHQQQQQQQQQQQNEEKAQADSTPNAEDQQKLDESTDEPKMSPDNNNQNEQDEHPEKMAGDDTPRTGTPHDESDYEDNIVVTVPKPQTLSSNYHDFRDRSHLNGRYNRSMSSNAPTSETDTPPSQQQSQHQYDNKESYGRHDMANKHNNAYGMHQFGHNRMMDEDGSKKMPQRWPKEDNSMYPQQMMPQQMQQHRQMPPNQMPPNHFHQNPPNNMAPQPYPDAYGMPPGKKPPPPFYPNQYPNQFYPKAAPVDMRSNYGGMPPMNHGHMMPHQPMPQMHHRPHAPMTQQSNAVVTAYQGVANKIGTGIIEDPLAAFEQIMKEKERRKKERARAIGSPRRRSRSIERRRSPVDRRSPRHNSTDSRDRGRSTDFRAVDSGLKDRSPSRNRDRHRNDKRRRRRSGSYHSRPSRSYSRSRSNSPHHHSRSPHRKHSRSPQGRRSRSRSGSYNRNRHRDAGRRDYRDREDYRDRSPNYYHNRGRGSYRGRGRGGNNYYRQDRGPMQQHQSSSSQHSNIPGKMPNWNQSLPNDSSMNYNDPSMNMMNSGMPRSSGGGGGYHDGNYHDVQSNSRYGSMPLHSPPGSHHMRPNHEFAPHVGHAIQEIHPTETNYENESNQTYPNNNRPYDVMPPGIEPPPPGSEGEASLAPPNRYSRERDWNDDYKNTNEKSDTRRQEQHRVQTSDRDSRSASRTNNEKVERKHYSKSPAPRDESRRKTNENREPAEREKRTRDSDRREQHVEKDVRRDRERDKDKEKEKEKEREKEREKEKRRNSSDDDKRERKSKDKKKKKKEEKSTDKKKKKEKKEKRERDSKKEPREKKVSNNSTLDTTQEFPEHSTTPPPQPKELDDQASASKSQDNDEISFNADESANIDLYGDINMDSETGGNDPNPNDDFGITNSPNRLNRSDSILDIHTNVEFEETDLQESESEGTNNKQAGNDDVFAAMPELSKWEREDDMATERALVDASPTDDQTKVTNEVLKRAENAIFARAINAIRPIEIKKICPERQKLYSNETKQNDMDKSPPMSSSIIVIDKTQLPPPSPTASSTPTTDDLLQITVNNSEQERSVEIKSGIRQPRNKTPIRSIKERLGKKINDDQRHSRSKTPQQRKVISDDNRNERKRRNSRTYSHRPDRQSTPEKKYRDRSDRGSREKRDKEPKSRATDSYDNKERSNRDNKGNRDRRESKNKETLDRGGHSRDRSSQNNDRRRFESKDRDGQQTTSRDDNRRHKDESTTQQRKQLDENRDDRRRRNSKSRHEKITAPTDSSNGQQQQQQQQQQQHQQQQQLAERRVNRSKSKTRTIEGRKRSRSCSSSSSSSSNSNSSDSSSDSEDKKRKKKRKHKKQKKSKKSKKKKKSKK